MTAEHESKYSPQINAVQFIVCLRDTGGGGSERLTRRPDLDHDISNHAFRGFEFTNRGSTHELIVQDVDAPMSDDAIVIIDSEQMCWADALARVRSTPSC